jgi:isopentenyl diphosphate isomerase/L-lactate dehydrogenase-like FMN-dependent dehydrogenase
MSRNAYAYIAGGAGCKDTIAGENGVYSVLRNFIADFELTMALSGCKDIREITADRLQRT